MKCPQESTSAEQSSQMPTRIQEDNFASLLSLCIDKNMLI